MAAGGGVVPLPLLRRRRYYGQQLTRGGARVVNNATSLSPFLSLSHSNLLSFFIASRLDLKPLFLRSSFLPSIYSRRRV